MLEAITEDDVAGPIVSDVNFLDSTELEKDLVVSSAQSFTMHTQLEIFLYRQ